MISIIVPVYNVEPYLKKCIDSIVNQTYRDLEILVIDDGSTDGSGRICDGYREDERVRVLHTENRGLSAARNLGLDEAKGEWIGFVDSDDWIEPDMYEVLIEKALETGADVVECGWYRELLNETQERTRLELKLSSYEAVKALVNQTVSDNVWNKLWKYQCFDKIRFPVGQIYEDIATTYRLFLNSECICTINKMEYHYIQRVDSLTKVHDMNNLMGKWLSHYERNKYFEQLEDRPICRIQIMYCAEAAGRIWSNYCDCKVDEDISENIMAQSQILWDFES